MVMVMMPLPPLLLLLLLLLLPPPGGPRRTLPCNARVPRAFKRARPPKLPRRHSSRLHGVRHTYPCIPNHARPVARPPHAPLCEQFLVDRDGVARKRFKPGFDPRDFEAGACAHPHTVCCLSLLLPAGWVARL